MKAILLFSMIFVFSWGFGQTNPLFTKKKEQCIYLMNEYNYKENVMRIQLKENMPEANRTIVENEFLNKKGFADFVYSSEKKVIYLNYLSFVQRAVIETILDQGRVSYSILSDKEIELEQRKEEK